MTFDKLFDLNKLIKLLKHPKNAMKKTILALLVLMLFAFSPQNTFACSCSSPTQKEEFKRSKAVFIGEFIRNTEENGVELKVTKSWKGVKAGEIIKLN